MATPLLFEPISFRSVTARNRIVVAPMCQYSATDGLGDDWHVQHLGARAMGGAGIVFTEATHVSAIGRITQHCLGLWNAQHQALLTRLAVTIPSEATSPATIGRQFQRLSAREKSAMTKTFAQRAAPLLVTTLLFAAPAFARRHPRRHRTSPASPGHPIRHHREGKAARQPCSLGQAARRDNEGLVERRIADLHSRLHITPQQSQQWDQFAQVMRDNAQARWTQIYQQRAEKLGSMIGGGQHAVLRADRAAARAGHAEARAGLPDAVRLAVRSAEEDGRPDVPQLRGERMHARHQAAARNRAQALAFAAAPALYAGARAAGRVSAAPAGAAP